MRAMEYRCAPWGLVLCLFGIAAGCNRPEPMDDRLRSFEPGALVPVSGVVTVNGKPVETLVVTFLPPSGPALGTAETDAEGKYELKSMAGPGVLPGDYTVAISYLVAEDGEPQGMAVRSSLNKPESMLTAKEKLPPEYSDLGRSKLSAKVGPKGETLNFDVPVPGFTIDRKSLEKKPEPAAPVAKEAVPEKPAPKAVESKDAKKKD